MNGTVDQTNILVSGIIEGLGSAIYDRCNIVICPAFVHLPQVFSKLKNSKCQLGAQDASAHIKGAYTGQISAEMLADIGCKYVIIAHSERRQYCFEDNALIAKKLTASISAGLTPIFCVGETQADYESGKTQSVIHAQLHEVIAQIGIEALGKCIIAYEPVWAIGTGKTATPEVAQQVHSMIRQSIAALDKPIAERVAILYGGSVNAGNAASLFTMPDIDGGLIGGASLKVEEFIQICRAAAH